MSSNLFYVDTCIWLNLFKKEDFFWKPANDFILNAMNSQDKTLFYSILVLKELKFKLTAKEFSEKHSFLSNQKNFRFVKALQEDFSFARKLEVASDFSLSFFDYLHIAICKRLGLILVTRDSLLLEIANKLIFSAKPEQLL